MEAERVSPEMVRVPEALNVVSPAASSVISADPTNCPPASSTLSAPAKMPLTPPSTLTRLPLTATVVPNRGKEPLTDATQLLRSENSIEASRVALKSASRRFPTAEKETSPSANSATVTVAYTWFPEPRSALNAPVTEPVSTPSVLVSEPPETNTVMPTAFTYPPVAVTDQLSSSV